jgi:hypothetical protein
LISRSALAAFPSGLESKPFVPISLCHNRQVHGQFDASRVHLPATCAFSLLTAIRTASRGFSPQACSCDRAGFRWPGFMKKTRGRKLDGGINSRSSSSLNAPLPLELATQNAHPRSILFIVIGQQPVAASPGNVPSSCRPRTKRYCPLDCDSSGSCRFGSLAL